jgi:pentatricopeptide repeat protein
VAHWEANVRALAAAAAAARGSRISRSIHEEMEAAAAAAEDGGMIVLGCEPTRRAWTALIKAHCDAGEVVAAAALLEEAIEAEAAKGGSQGARGGGSTGDGGGAGSAAGGKRGGKGKGKGKSSDRNKATGVELITFNLVAAAFSRAGEPQWGCTSCESSRPP